jgi:hypothetical protein
MEQTSEIMAYLSALGLIEMDAISVCLPCCVSGAYVRNLSLSDRRECKMMMALLGEDEVMSSSSCSSSRRFTVAVYNRMYEPGMKLSLKSPYY